MYNFHAFTLQGESTAWHFSFFSADGKLAETLIAGKEKLFLSHFIKNMQKSSQCLRMSCWDLTQSRMQSRKPSQSVEQNKALLAQGKLSMPLLAVAGEGRGSLGQTQIDQMNKYAANVQGHVLRGYGHWLMEERLLLVEPLAVGFFDEK